LAGLASFVVALVVTVTIEVSIAKKINSFDAVNAPEQLAATPRPVDVTSRLPFRAASMHLISGRRRDCRGARFGEAFVPNRVETRFEL
jgi:hypothetical protein